MVPDLVVIFNSELETNIINEFYKTRIPILSFNYDFLNILKITYKTPGNFNFIKKNITITYFFLLYSILKKTNLNNKSKLIKKFSITNKIHLNKRLKKASYRKKRF